jgi:alpha-glucosidase
VELALGEFPLFIRRGCVLPLAKGAEYVAGVDASQLTLLGWLDGDAAITLYDDDGESDAINLAAGLTEIRVSVTDGKATASAPGKTLDTSRIIIG